MTLALIMLGGLAVSVIAGLLVAYWLLEWAE